MSSNNGDEASALVFDHLPRIVVASSVGGNLAYHSRDEGVDRPLDSVDTKVKTILNIKVPATTNLNNLIGVAHLREAPSGTSESVCLYNSAAPLDETHDKTSHDDVAYTRIVLSVLDSSRSMPNGSLKLHCAVGPCLGRTVTLGLKYYV